MKKIILAPFMMLSFIVFAEPRDPLDELASSLGRGTYVQEYVEKKESTPNVESIWVMPEDYKKIGISLAYPDSDVLYLPGSRTYAEVKKFGDVLMIRSLDSEINSALFYLSGDTGPLDESKLDILDKAWEVRCIKDHITSEKICRISKFEVSILKSSNSGLSVMPSKQLKSLNYSKTHYLKIDGNKALQTNLIFKGNAAVNAINQMKKGEIMYTRFTEWDGETYEETISLYGFSAAYSYMNLMYSRL